MTAIQQKRLHEKVDKVEKVDKLKEFDPVSFFSKKELCYYKMIDKFFKGCSEDKIVKMLNIIDGQSEISLRILDWFVTKYSKRGIDFTRNGDVFDVHINYKAQLKSYKKRYFDPFKRKRKFNYKYIVNGEEKNLYTTIGQLNFFRWAIGNEIIDFVEKYLPQITKAMNLSNKEEKKKRKNDKSTNSKNSTDSDSSDSDTEDNEDESDNSSSESSKSSSCNKHKHDKHKHKHKHKNDSDKHNQKHKNKNKNINVNAIKNIKDDEVELILCFD